MASLLARKRAYDIRVASPVLCPLLASLGAAQRRGAAGVGGVAGHASPQPSPAVPAPAPALALAPLLKPQCGPRRPSSSSSSGGGRPAQPWQARRAGRPRCRLRTPLERGPGGDGRGRGGRCGRPAVCCHTPPAGGHRAPGAARQRGRERERERARGRRGDGGGAAGGGGMRALRVAPAGVHGTPVFKQRR
jgi:hypothetical protein